MDYFAQCDNLIRSRILQFLDIEAIWALYKTCKEWREIIIASSDIIMHAQSCANCAHKHASIYHAIHNTSMRGGGHMIDSVIHCRRYRAVMLAHNSTMRVQDEDLAPMAREIFDAILALNNDKYDRFSPKLARKCAQLMRAQITKCARCSTCGRITFNPGSWQRMRDSICNCSIPHIVDIVTQSIVRAIWTRKWTGNDEIARVLPREPHLLSFAHEALDDFCALTRDEPIIVPHAIDVHEPIIPLHYLTINYFRYRGFFIEESHVFRAISGATFAKFLAYMIFGEKRLFGRDMANISLFETDHILAKVREIRPDILEIPSIAKLVAAHRDQMGSVSIRLA